MTILVWCLSAAYGQESVPDARDLGSEPSETELGPLAIPGDPDLAPPPPPPPPPEPVRDPPPPMTVAPTATPISTNAKRRLGRYTEGYVAVGALWAPDVDLLVGSGTELIGNVRLYGIAPMARNPVLSHGLDIELGGSSNLYYRGRLRYLVGLFGNLAPGARAGVNIGLGWTEIDDAYGSVAVPLHATLGIAPVDALGVQVRGGVNYAFIASGINESTLYPEVVASLSIGERQNSSIHGVRFDVGWRDEVVGDVFTLMVGYGR